MRQIRIKKKGDHSFSASELVNVLGPGDDIAGNEPCVDEVRAAHMVEAGEATRYRPTKKKAAKKKATSKRGASS